MEEESVRREVPAHYQLSTGDGYHRAFYRLFRHVFGLTRSLAELISLMSEERERLLEEGLPEDVVAKLLLTTGARKRYVEAMGTSASTVDNFLAALVGKGLLRRKGEGWEINPKAVPVREVVVRLASPEEFAMVRKKGLAREEKEASEAGEVRR